MGWTIQVMLSGFALAGLSVLILYFGGITFYSLSVAVTLLWIAALLILVSRAARRVSKHIKPEE